MLVHNFAILWILLSCIVQQYEIIVLPIIFFLIASLHTLFSFQGAFFSNLSVCWWAQVDSNHRPHAYQACALTTWAMSPFSRRCVPLQLLVEMNGIEPMTPCLQSRCSPSWATPPYFIWGISEFSFRSLKIEQQAIRTRFVIALSRRLFGFGLLLNYRLSKALLWLSTFSIERRWSSRTFRYGYLVTT